MPYIVEPVPAADPLHLDPAALQEAKRQLGIDCLALQIHDASFPCDPGEDLGRGSPYSFGAERLLAFATRLGFDTIQLGPGGLTCRGNPSPYDGTIFSRNPMSLPWLRLVGQGRLPIESVQAAVADSRAHGSTYEQAYDRCRQLVAALLEAASEADRAEARTFLAREPWVLSDALYEILAREHGTVLWQEWGSTGPGAIDQRLFNPPDGGQRAADERIAQLQRRFQRPIEDYALVQWLLDRERRDFRRRLAEHQLRVYADLQVGLSLRDYWAWQKLFLPDYRLGAPPSRTNPLGQPWGFPVFDPYQLGTPDRPGPVLEFVRQRIHKVLAESHNVRIDHTHGWVDPWVYRSDDPDPVHAVQHGARLFSSPAATGHPLLRGCAIARPEQLDFTQLEYTDHYVVDLDDEQVARYSVMMDTIVEQLRARGTPPASMACEVLSTLPYQLRRVLDRYQVGRFRVAQKIDHDDSADVYRLENSQLEDWVMLGTHDTPPIWKLAQDWCRGAEGPRWGGYLAGLAPDGDREGLAGRVAGDPGELVHELFTAMLACRARHVVVFFADLFGLTDRYNEPGMVHERNWRLQLPGEFEPFYRERCRRGEALDVHRCLVQALHRRRAAGM